MKTTYSTIILLTLAACGSNGQSKKAKLKSKTDTAYYALGVEYGKSIRKNAEGEINKDAFVSGILDALNGKDSNRVKNTSAVVQRFMSDQREAKSEKARKEGEDFLAKNKERKDVRSTSSGLQYRIIKEGNGPKPTKNDKVTTHYVGKFIDGKVFDSSVDRGEPTTFPVTGVIPGWVEALQLMPVGSKWELYIPQDLAYGARGQGPIPPYSVLIFEIELLEIAD
tara:strand:- start:128 stop:799 length:672 start_codon:yes stop_codon:yes gene_type:complete